MRALSFTLFSASLVPFKKTLKGPFMLYKIQSDNNLFCGRYEYECGLTRESDLLFYYDFISRNHLLGPTMGLAFFWRINYFFKHGTHKTNICTYILGLLVPKAWSTLFTFQPRQTTKYTIPALQVGDPLYLLNSTFTSIEANHTSNFLS